MEMLSVIDTRIDIIIAIVGIVEVLKRSIEKRQLSIYMLGTLVFSFLVAGVDSPADWKEVVLNTIVYFGLATFFYQAILRYIRKVNINLDQKIDQMSSRSE